MYISMEEMAKAAELTRAGRLHEATEAIQRALAGGAAPAPGSPAPDRSGVAAEQAANRADVSDVAFRELPVPPGRTPLFTEPATPPVPVQAEFKGPESFARHEFHSGGKAYGYWLFQPGDVAAAAPRPVIVMLHGCTQDGMDFAGGTAMNEFAAREGCIVVYPEQRQDANSMRCWNWFEPAHQKRGTGEPAMVAALALEVASACNGDVTRIYVAGLSAGGAMATLVAQLYPDVFAAAGVHSGLPAGVATDMVGALAAMRKPAGKQGAMAQQDAAVPTIVFHGNSDRTVHPANGKRIVQEAIDAFDRRGTALQPKTAKPAQSARTVKRTQHVGADGKPWVESWEVVGAPHAWAGGRAAGSYTDPQGPDASEAMLAFFLQHRRA